MDRWIQYAMHDDSDMWMWYANGYSNDRGGKLNNLVKTYGTAPSTTQSVLITGKVLEFVGHHGI